MPVVDIGGTDYEVMASIADHDSFLAADITRGTTWGSVTAANKNLSAVAVFRFFETLNWIGEADSASAPWPRTIDGTSQTPPGVISAAYILASDVSGDTSLIETFKAERAKGAVIKVEAGSAKVTFDSPTASQLAAAGQQTRPVPDSVWALLRPWLKTSDTTSAGAGIGCGAYVSGAEADDSSEREYGITL